jgi:ribose/xylose/arabinose/galactoside ABC-type transport system permease subunit
MNNKTNSLLHKLHRHLNLNSISIIVMVFIVICLSLIVPRFLTLSNIINVLEQLTTMGFLCLGMTFVLIVGGIDLSMPAVLMASATSGALFMINGGNLFGGIIIIFLVGVFFGFVNGLAISKARMMPFIVTLSTMVVAKGFATMITDAVSLYGLPDNFLLLSRKIGIIPVPVIIFFLFAFIAHIILTKTKYGRIYYMIGLNNKAATISGIQTAKYIGITYIISSILSAVAGIFLIAKTNMAGASLIGDTMIMDTVGAAIIGGASLSGGKGSILGSFCGALFITLISNFINLMNIDYYTGMIIKGGLIMLAIGLDRLRSRYLFKGGN